MSVASPIDHHKSGLARLRQSEEFSDCKLICGPYHFNLHKVILASQSDYFKAAFKQGTFKEGDSGVIELKIAQSDGETAGDGDDAYDEPQIVKLMVDYFYHFDYLHDTESLLQPTSNAQSAEIPPATKKAKHGPTQRPHTALQSSQLPPQVYITEHAKVFAIAVKYQIDGLRDLAALKFKQAATAYWSHDDFAHSVHIVFNSTAEEVTQLREIVSDILHQHFDNLEAKPEVEAVVCNTPRLAYALLKRSRARGKNGGFGFGKQNYFAIPQDADLECDECGSQLVTRSDWDGDWRCPYCS